MRSIFLKAVRLSVPAVLLIFVSSPGNLTRATTIVVARTANEIVIGADSKVTDAFGGDLKKQACKILQIGPAELIRTPETTVCGRAAVTRAPDRLLPRISRRTGLMV